MHDADRSRRAEDAGGDVDRRRSRVRRGDHDRDGGEGVSADADAGADANAASPRRRLREVLRARRCGARGAQQERQGGGASTYAQPGAGGLRVPGVLLRQHDGAAATGPTIASTPAATRTLLEHAVRGDGGRPAHSALGGTTARGCTPLSPPSYSTFNNTVAGADFAATMSVRVASGLEAQYIVAEAQGPTAATLAFVNERRAAGLQTP